MLRKNLFYLLLAMILPIGMIAQVTNSSMNGTVKTSDNTPLIGVTVTATHTPSGTKYVTSTKSGGVFNLPNLRIGGPYTVKFDYVGLQSQEVTDIYLVLGEPFKVDINMQAGESKLADVTVTGTKRKLSVDKTGASTNVGQRQLQTLPTISRSITDFTRLTPQANGNSFAGRDGRYNNVQVNGANLNNNFGLSTDPLPGGGNQPISIDAIEEISINIAPFDVRQANFTGAGINAVTKSGSNTFKGSVYGLYRDQTYNGRNVGDFKLPDPVLSKNQIFGFTVGGPIIKDKLFFFAGYEQETREFPGITWSPTGGSGIGNRSNTHIDSLRKFSNHLRTAYGYETGAFDNFPNFTAENTKIIARVDWNIASNHKLSVNFNQLTSENDAQLNGTSIPNVAAFAVRNGAGTVNVSAAPNGRFGINSMSFRNSNYRFKDVVRNVTAELSSNFKGKFSNQLLLTLTNIQSTRVAPGGIFPSIEIFNNNGQNYMFAGTDPFTRNNDVKNDVFSVTNNLTYYAGKHTITGGVSFENQYVGNMFMPGSASYYAFNSLDDFINNRPPAFFSYLYSLVPGRDAIYAAELKVNQLGLYIQDEFNVNSKLKLTYGVRVDRVGFPENPITNPAIDALQFANSSGVVGNHYKTGEWPKSPLYWSPRVGFRWDVKGDKSLVVRGGTGIFTGRIPFVFLTNIPQNGQMVQRGEGINNPAQLANFLFNPNPDFYRNRFTAAPGTSVSNNANLVFVDNNFKFPQIWRTNFAFDKNFNDGWTLTLEGMYSKDINAVRMRNANERPTNTDIGGRAGFALSGTGAAAQAARRINSGVNSAIVLENINLGESMNFTAQISKAFKSGFYGSLAYTFTAGWDVTANPGSQAISVFNGNRVVGSLNGNEVFNSQFVQPHRVIGTFSYRFEWAKHFATTFSLFYEGGPQGNPISYAYNGDHNNDGFSSDLLFVPRNAATDMTFTQFTFNGVTFTPAQQAAAFNQFIDNSPYLRNRRGQFAERNATFAQWFNRVDARIVQDIFSNFGGKRKHTLQFTADILNFANMLNRNWGIRHIPTLINPVQVSMNGTTATYQFRNFTGSGANTQLNTQPFQRNNSFASTWGMQLGLRYIF